MNFGIFPFTKDLRATGKVPDEIGDNVYIAEPVTKGPFLKPETPPKALSHDLDPKKIFSI
jgi:hypothetical protein